MSSKKKVNANTGRDTRSLKEILESDDYFSTSYYNFIVEKLQNRERVPLYVFDRFVKSIGWNPYEPNKVDFNPSQKEFESILNKFNNKHYRFNCSKDAIKWTPWDSDNIEQKVTIYYSLEGLVKKMLIEGRNNVRKAWSTEETVCFLYEVLDNYISSAENEMLLEQYNPYKKAALSTCVAIYFGAIYSKINLNNIEHASPHNLFQVSRNHLKKMLSKKNI